MVERFQADAADIQKKADCLQEIEHLQARLDESRKERKAQKRKVPISSLPEDERPTQLMPVNKVLTDTVKMIAYRAETALVALLLPHLTKEAEARALVRELLVSSADIEPDEGAGTLTVRIHRMVAPTHDRATEKLLEDLTKLGFRHPETNAKMVYTLVKSANPDSA